MSGSLLLSEDAVLVRQENLIRCKARANIIFIVDLVQPGLFFRLYIIWLLTFFPHYGVTLVSLNMPGFLVAHLVNKLCLKIFLDLPLTMLL